MGEVPVRYRVVDHTDPLPDPLPPRTGKLTLLFLAVVAVGLGLAALLRTPVNEGGPMAESVAPEVVNNLFDGGIWRLSVHLAEDGRPVILNLWASWCLPCREEIPELSTFAVDNPDWAVIGVAVNDREADARALAEELAPSYPVGMDATGTLRDRYASFGMPVTYVIDPSGVIRHQIEGGITAAELESLLG